MEIEIKSTSGPTRTKILFEAIYRIYLDNGHIQTECFYHDSVFLGTLGFHSDFSEEILESLDVFFDDPLEFINAMLGHDPKFRIDLKSTEEVYIHILGDFKEETFTEGSWEEGYYDCLRLIPIVRGYEIVPKKDVLEFLKEEGEYENE